MLVVPSRFPTDLLEARFILLSVQAPPRDYVSALITSISASLVAARCRLARTLLHTHSLTSNAFYHTSTAQLVYLRRVPSSLECIGRVDKKASAESNFSCLHRAQQQFSKLLAALENMPPSQSDKEWLSTLACPRCRRLPNCGACNVAKVL